jgi:hypothetical protein
MKATNKISYILSVMLFLVAFTVTAQKKITVAELPKEAQSFLKKHFSSETVRIAKKDWEHGENGYEVILSNGTEVEFSKDGKIREVDGHGNPIPTAFIEKSILDYVSKNYPNNKITHIDYGHKDIDVDLTGKVDLEFSKEGKFIKVD